MEYEICRRETLTASVKAAMLELIQENYLGVKRKDFYRDLSQEDYVILLRKDQQLCGFSTFRLFRHEYSGEQVLVAFSGDTIICKENRNSRILPISFGVLMNSIESEYDMPLFWMLISKGFRTYRFLPVYFEEFFPVFDRETPAYEKGLIESLSERLFDKRFCPESGVVAGCGQTVKNILEDKEVIERRSDPHINFFNCQNPGWINGDELVCLVRYRQSNLNPFIARRLEAEEARETRVAQ